MSVVHILTLCCLVSCWSRERATSCGSLIVVPVQSAILALRNVRNVCDSYLFLLVKLIKFFSLPFYILLYQLWRIKIFLAPLRSEEEALRHGMCSQGISQSYRHMHPHVYPQSE